METKRCLGCDQVKPIGEFGIRSYAKSRINSRCIDCEKKRSSEYAKNELEKRRKSRLKYDKENRDPQKKRARHAVSYEILSGRMLPANQQQCVHCGNQATMHDHHLGYDESNKLNVVPVCDDCNRRLRRERREYAKPKTLRSSHGGTDGVS